MGLISAALPIAKGTYDFIEPHAMVTISTPSVPIQTLSPCANKSLTRANPLASLRSGEGQGELLQSGCLSNLISFSIKWIMCAPISLEPSRPC